MGDENSRKSLRHFRARKRAFAATVERLEVRRLLSATVYVDASAAGTDDGSSWTNAYTDLQSALTAATTGTTIDVAQGVYKPTSGADRTATFSLKDGVIVEGGFAGVVALSSNPDARDLELYASTLSGDITDTGFNSTGIGFNYQSSYHVVTASGTDSTAVLNGFMITDGNADDFNSINTSIAGNGGGLVDIGGSPTITDCTFERNRAVTGAAIYVDGGTPSITGCTFEYDRAQDGGGIYSESGGCDLLNSVFQNEYVIVGGSAIEIHGEGGTITGCQFSNDLSSENIVGGGAIEIANGQTLTISQSTFTHNSGLFGGAIDVTATGAPTENINDCIFDGNSAQDVGAIEFGPSSATVTNCIFAANSAVFVGAIDGSNLQIDNSTFTGNTDSSPGSAAVAVSSGTLTNCILWGDTNNSAISEISGNSTSVSYSNIDGGYAGIGNISADPQFISSPSPGADGVWGTVDDDYGNLKLSPSSPAVNAGNNADVPAEITTDLTGDDRIQYVPTGNNIGLPTTPVVDMGAYETAPQIDADAGPAVEVVAGQTIGLDGSGSGVSGPLQFAWTFTGNGPTENVTGVDPIFDSAGFAANSVVSAELTITDGDSHSAMSSTTITILPTILRVDASATGADNGESWTNAYSNLSTALNNAVPGQTIDVAQGTYTPTDGADRAETFQLIDGVTIEGGFAGLAGAEPDARDLNLYPSILSGDIGTVGDNSDNSYHVVYCAGTDSTSVLDGFTITGGNADGSNADVNGGGLYSNSGAAIISHCTFTGNFAFFGGAVFTKSSGPGGPSPTFTNCIFTGNSAGEPGGFGGGGGAFFNTQSAPLITDSIFVNNQSPNYGGTVNDANAAPIIVNCTFTDNATGDAICDSFSYGATLANCILWGDTASIEIGDFLGADSNVNYCDVQGGTSGTGNIDADPMFVDAADGNLALQQTSPCINAGSNTAVPLAVTTDLAGNARIFGGTVDMGAYELQSRPASLVAVQYPTNARAGSKADATIAVAFEDQDSNILVGVDQDVTLSIQSGPAGAMLGGKITVAAQNGVATFSQLSLDMAGNYTLSASSGKVTANLPQFTVIPAAAAKLVFVPPPTSIGAGLIISPAVTVKVEDAFGNLVAGSPKVVLSVAAGPASSKLGGATAVSAVNGIATFGNLSVTISGGYKLKAASGSISATSTSFTAIAVKTSFKSQPLIVVAGNPIATAFVIEVADKNGNLITSSNANVTLTLKAGPKGAALGGTTSVALQNGLAKFNNLNLTVAGSYTLMASINGVGTVVSLPCKVEPAAAAALTIAQQPTVGKHNSALSPHLLVDVRDQYGNLISGNNQVTVSVFSSSNGGILSGTLTATTINGVATFNKLILSLAGTYVLSVSDGELTRINTGEIKIS